MEHIIIKKGLNLPISGAPEPTIRKGAESRRVALIGDDSVGMKPTMEVQVGDMVKTGQLLFTNKKSQGQRYVAPGCGKVVAINRGAKRKFESLVIELMGDEAISFVDNPGQPVENLSAEAIREVLAESGLWASFRTRPYGKIPEIDTLPASLFITAIDSEPLAPPPELIISAHAEDYKMGLDLLDRLLEVPVHYCSADRELGIGEKQENFNYWTFTGPHPAGLASTHIHFIDPVHEKKTVWHIGYQDVIAIGYLFRTGTLMTERTISLAGPGVRNPSLVTTRLGTNLHDLCAGELRNDTMRIISGSVLSGRNANEHHAYLGRYHNQVSVLPDNSGRSLLNWALPGASKFSVKPVFTSAMNKLLKLDMNTAVWGGHRAIYPLGTYEDVMPLDIIPTYLMRALLVGDTEKSKALGCLELIEEDVAPCSFVCPGKNEFGTNLRQVLTTIEIEG
ncbi:Na(+)-translocating NADH-quinone reductase subunit A [Desulfosediminicola sp.]|uniref:Na(+)-translocating NADH-quinone reductase subunit A n=1 Tax=Desulfosediminicola sp. TaxID=2886825 RepID=UPI003AF2644D